MPTIDLSTPPPPPTGLLDALPRRASLTLPELRLVAERAGDPPLPFDVRATLGSSATHLEDRLGLGPDTAADQEYATALASLHDPALSLERRGLLGDGSEARGLLGAVGLLATPTTALDLDVVAGTTRAKSWHRRAGDAVATLSTVDGLVFELAWFGATQWAAELGRAPILPGDLPLRASAVPESVDLPYELADAAAEAIHSGRGELLPVLTAQHTGTVLDPTGAPLPDVEVTTILAALSGESQGRLRAMVADVTAPGTPMVGVVSWTLLSDGWHALHPRAGAPDRGIAPRVVVTRVEPTDLAAELAPVLAEVIA